jgi:hypothetical protein
MAKFNAGDAETLKQAWQRYYFLGKLASTGEQVPSHASKIRLDMPLDQRQRKRAAATSVAPAAELAAQPISQLGMQEANRTSEQPASAPRAKRKPKTPKPRPE